MSVLREVPTGYRQTYCLPLGLIQPSPWRYRKKTDESGLMALAASIRQHGLLEPIAVRPNGPYYEILWGERRFQACRMLGYLQIDAFIFSVQDRERTALSLIENGQRQELHFFEWAEAFDAMRRQGMAPESIARQTGKSPAWVSGKLRLLSLAPELRTYMMETGLTECHAQALLPLPDPEARSTIAHQAAQLRLSPRETGLLVTQALARLPDAPARRKVISVVREPRLYINAIGNILREMRQAGMDAALETEETEAEVALHIRVRKIR